MPGTALQKQHGILTALALTALAALLTLTGCAPRKPIPLDEPRIATKAPAEAPPAPAPVKTAKAMKPAQLKAAPAKPAESTPAQAEPTPASQEKDAANAPTASAGQTAPAGAERQSYVQVGAFGTAMNALGAVAWLKGKGYESSRMVRAEQGQGTLFRVQAGPFQDLATAHKALEALKPDWPQAFIPQD